jgi:hypothetical protein
MSERFTVGTKPLFAWSPFMVAQNDVLGKDYPSLRGPLENPGIDEPKAFEALTQLAVLVRLLSKQSHPLVPVNPEIGDSVFKGTEMFHISADVENLEGIVTAVHDRYVMTTQVVQVVAVPLFSSFPAYDFFLMHKIGGEWKVAAGY